MDDMPQRRCAHCHQVREIPDPEHNKSWRAKLGLCMECWFGWLQQKVDEELETRERVDPPPPALPST